jgi:hypothetical protein
MPILKFLLTNQALRLHIEKGVETSSLYGLMPPLNALMISMRTSRCFAREKSVMPTA